MASSKPIVAAFDFDDTLITRNTLWDFLWFISNPVLFFWNIFLVSPSLCLFAAKQISNTAVKQRLLTRFIGAMDEQAFAQHCKLYAARLDKIANVAGLECVKRHQNNGDTVLIISASAEDWITPWARTHNISTVIATRLERQNGKLTGRLNGPNCHGQEKATRFLAQFPDRENYQLYMYGDGKSDKAMFALANHVYKKHFDTESLARYA